MNTDKSFAGLDEALHDFLLCGIEYVSGGI
jgi:hypothetical protein